jgi:afadin
MDEQQLAPQMQQHPPLPPTSTHPLFKNVNIQQQVPTNYTISDASKVSLNLNYQQQQQQQHQQQGSTKNISSSPWEREEREKEIEMKREQIRHWRDQQIVELSLLANKTQQQEEQLKTLVLERDFERRALEEEKDDELDVQYQKSNSNVQEILRLQQQQLHPNVQTSNSNNNSINQNTPPVFRSKPTSKQVEIKQQPIVASTANISPNSDGVPDNINAMMMQSQPLQPKGILKSTNSYNSSNPVSPSKHGKVTSFASEIDAKNQNLTEITMNNTNANQILSQIDKGMSDLSINFQNDENIIPPPPPERNSSFAVMHQQKMKSNFPKLSFNEHPIINNHNQINNNNNSVNASQKFIQSNQTEPIITAQQLQQQMNIINNNNILSRDNKRVSFHDRENNNTSVLDYSPDQDYPTPLRDQNPNVSNPFLSITFFK